MSGYCRNKPKKRHVPAIAAANGAPARSPNCGKTGAQAKSSSLDEWENRSDMEGKKLPLAQMAGGAAGGAVGSFAMARIVRGLGLLAGPVGGVAGTIAGALLADYLIDDEEMGDRVTPDQLMSPNLGSVL